MTLCTINYSERWVSLKSVFKLLFLGLLRNGPSPGGAYAGLGSQRWRVRMGILLQVRLAAGFACLLLVCVSGAALLC